MINEGRVSSSKYCCKLDWVKRKRKEKQLADAGRQLRYKNGMKRGEVPLRCLLGTQ